MEYDQAQVADTLLEMSKYFIELNPPHVFDAVRCLESICQAPQRFSSYYEAKARIGIAEILLSQNMNFHQAKSHLDVAVITTT